MFVAGLFQRRSSEVPRGREDEPVPGEPEDRRLYRLQRAQRAPGLQGQRSALVPAGFRSDAESCFFFFCSGVFAIQEDKKSPAETKTAKRLGMIAGGTGGIKLGANPLKRDQLIHK